MKKSMVLVFGQLVLTVLLYSLGAVVIGLSLFPSLWMVYEFWMNASSWPLPARLAILGIVLAAGYFIFGIMFIILGGVTRVLLGLKVKEGLHKVGSLEMIKWMVVSSIYIAMRVLFMEFMLLTPLMGLFYRLMGAKLGRNVQINSVRVGDIGMLDIGDNTVIGGNANVICHSFEREGLHVKQTRIGKNCVIGLNSIILSGVDIGDGSVVAAGAVVPKNTVIPPRSIYYSKDKVVSR